METKRCWDERDKEKKKKNESSEKTQHRKYYKNERSPPDRKSLKMVRKIESLSFEKVLCKYRYMQLKREGDRERKRKKE